MGAGGDLSIPDGCRAQVSQEASQTESTASHECEKSAPLSSSGHRLESQVAISPFRSEIVSGLGGNGGEAIEAGRLLLGRINRLRRCTTTRDSFCVACLQRTSCHSTPTSIYGRRPRMLGGGSVWANTGWQSRIRVVCPRNVFSCRGPTREKQTAPKNNTLHELPSRCSVRARRRVHANDPLLQHLPLICLDGVPEDTSLRLFLGAAQVGLSCSKTMRDRKSVV